MEFGNPHTENAKIKFTALTVEDGNLIMQIGFDVNGGKTVISDKKVITDTFIRDMLNVLEVRSWEEMPRKYARIRINNDKVVAVGNLIENKWLEI